VDLQKYVKQFTDRKVHPFIEDFKEKVLFQYECLYKSLEDPSNIIDEEQLFYGGDMYTRIECLSLHVTEFYEHKLDLIVMSPPFAKLLHNIIF
jgi:hypothetical protein